MEYFGETDSARCGICDVCKQLETLELSAYDFEVISKEVKKILRIPITYEKLLLKLKGDQQKKRQVVKWLLDNHRIVYRIDNQLEWAEE